MRYYCRQPISEWLSTTPHVSDNTSRNESRRLNTNHVIPTAIKVLEMTCSYSHICYASFRLGYPILIDIALGAHCIPFVSLISAAHVGDPKVECRGAPNFRRSRTYVMGATPPSPSPCGFAKLTAANMTQSAAGSWIGTRLRSKALRRTQRDNDSHGKERDAL
jgi:hypothetical protein